MAMGAGGGAGENKQCMMTRAPESSPSVGYSTPSIRISIVLEATTVAS